MGDPMPEDQPILPEPEVLRVFTVSGVLEGIHHPPPPTRDRANYDGSARDEEA